MFFDNNHDLTNVQLILLMWQGSKFVNSNFTYILCVFKIKLEFTKWSQEIYKEGKWKGKKNLPVLNAKCAIYP